MARILVVDDDGEQLRLRTQLLTLSGHEVSTASTVAEAIRLLQEVQPAVLLADLCLPALSDGLKLIRAAAGHAAQPRIVVLSGWPEQLDGLPEAGLISQVLMKPSSLAALLQAIRLPG